MIDETQENNQNPLGLDRLMAYKPLRNPINMEIVKRSTMLLGLKYLIWGTLILLTLVTGFARYLGDWSISRGYPSDLLAWGGFAFVIYILLSTLTFYLDWMREFTLGIKSGFHAMPWVSVFGRWIRKIFIDGVGFALLCFFMQRMYFSLKTAGHQGPAGGSAPQWWLLASIIAIIVIPLWFQVRNTLLLLTGNSFHIFQKGDNRNMVKAMAKRFGITLLGVFTFDLTGDYNAESRLFGFFGVYILFIPGHLQGKEVMFASIAKVFAQAKVLQGTVINIIRWFAFVFFTYITYLGFNMAYSSTIFTWFSETALTGDPALNLLMLLAIGFCFLLATPVVNITSKNFEVGANNLAVKMLGRSDIFEQYLNLVDSGKGVSGKRDMYTEIGLMDTIEASKAKEYLKA